MKKVRVIEFSLIVVAAAFMLLAILINGTKTTAMAVNEGNIIEGKDFAISNFGYDFKSNSLTVSYSIVEKAGRDEEFTIAYTLRDLSGNKLGDGQQNVIVPALGKSDFKAKIPISLDSKGPFRLSFSAWNGQESQWAIKDIGLGSSKISGLVIQEKTDSAGWSVLTLLTLTFVCLLIVLYLRRHHAKIAALEPQKKKLIAFELSDI